MTVVTRRDRIKRAKALGRAAYRLARGGDIVGNIEVDGEEKRLMEYRRGGLLIELWQPWRSTAAETEFSRLRVTHGSEKVSAVGSHGPVQHRALQVRRLGKSIANLTRRDSNAGAACADGDARTGANPAFDLGLDFRRGRGRG